MQTKRQTPQIPRIATASAIVLAAAALFASSAAAVPLHPPTAFSPITGAGIGTSLHRPRGLGADEVSGRLFVTSDPPGVVDIFNSEGGVPAGIASPYQITGFNFEVGFPSIAVDNSAAGPNKGVLYVTNPRAGKVTKYARNPVTEKYEATGELTSIPASVSPGGITVDEQGDVYVAGESGGSEGFGTITKFSPSGTQLWQTELSAGTRHPRTVAVDNAGDLFIGVDASKAFELPANGLGQIEAGNFVEVPIPDQGNGVAVDQATATLYVAHQGNFTEFEASTLREKGDFSLGADEGFTQIAINHAAGLIYVTKQDPSPPSVLAFNLNGATVPDAGTTNPSPLQATRATLHGTVNPQGLAVGECKFEYGLRSSKNYEASTPCEGSLPTDSANHAVTAEATGLTKHTDYRYRLVVSNANGENHSANKLFTTEGVAQTKSATAITPASATLNGAVLPEGSPVSECKFEYGTTTAYGSTVPCSPEAGAIPADFEAHAVSANLSGLVVGTTYHYRLVVSGGLGSETGEDQSFVTLGPSILSESFSGLTETAVKLEATINPRGKATTYHFEYGSQGSCEANPCTSVPVPDGVVGSGSSGVEVSQLVKGLTAATTYHYRVVVSSPDGVGHGSESTFTTYDVPPGFGSCANDQFRLGHPSALLPDCRVYEQATPVDKNGGDANGTLYKVQASVSGDGITSQTKGGLPGAEGAERYGIFLSRRGATDWSTQGFLPPPTYGDNILAIAWTPDLAYSFSNAAFASSDQGNGFDNALLLRSSVTHAVQQVTPYLDDASYEFAGASADDSRLFFEARGPGVDLTGDAAGGKDNLYLYEPASEELSLVGVLPGGSAPPGGSFAGPFNWWSGSAALNGGGALGINQESKDGYLTQDMHAISADGSRAFFTAGGTGKVYVREGIGGPEPETAQISASQRSPADPGGAKPAIFMDATPSGSEAFFTSCQKLTDDSTAHSTAAGECDTAAQGQDLYAYDTETRQLSDLTVDHEAGDPQGAEVEGLIGTSADGSYVYFVANGDLDGGGPAERGNCQHHGATDYGPPGTSCNLYLWHENSVAFVTRLEPAGGVASSDASNWLPGGNTGEEGTSTGRVSADGKTVVFRSRLQQTGYAIKGCGGTCPEFYRYHAGDAGVTCVTCNPTGAPPAGAPTQESIEVGLTPFIHPLSKRYVSASGNQVFFETRDKLVGTDTNGDDGCPSVSRPAYPIATCQDVYEWEAPGAGSCSEASSAFSGQDGGCLYLLSSGTSPDPSFLGDASASGEDVYIFTGSRLVPQDEDDNFDIYDAHAGGGLASQNQPPPPEPCESSASCRQGAGTPPSGPSAGSASFQGPPSPPVTRHKKHKKHRKHHKRAHGHPKRAGANRGGGR